MQKRTLNNVFEYHNKLVFDKDDGHTNGVPPTTYYNMFADEKQLLAEYITACVTNIDGMDDYQRQQFDSRIKPRLTNKTKDSARQGKGKRYTLEGVISDLYSTTQSKKYNPTESMLNRWNKIFEDEGWGINLVELGEQTNSTSTSTQSNPLEKFFTFE